MLALPRIRSQAIHSATVPTWGPAITVNPLQPPEVSMHFISLTTFKFRLDATGPELEHRVPHVRRQSIQLLRRGMHELLKLLSLLRRQIVKNSSSLRARPRAEPRAHARHGGPGSWMPCAKARVTLHVGTVPIAANLLDPLVRRLRESTTMVSPVFYVACCANSASLLLPGGRQEL